MTKLVPCNIEDLKITKKKSYRDSKAYKILESFDRGIYDCVQLVDHEWANVNTCQTSIKNMYDRHKDDFKYKIKIMKRKDQVYLVREPK